MPARPARSEHVEKRSRFMAHLWPTDSEEQARTRIAEIKAKYHDARHNCWCYRISGTGVSRYSDDGEPQGTAGQPMLEVFSRQGVEDFCCVVTRYFGGILLGTGGLRRAYVKAARDSLDAAGIAEIHRLIRMELVCPYSLFERVKLEVETAEGMLDEADYGQCVHVSALLPPEKAEGFTARVTELSAGEVIPKAAGEAFRSVLLHEK